MKFSREIHKKNDNTVFNFLHYSKTCLKLPLKKEDQNWFSRPIIALCRSKVFKNAFCNTFDLHLATIYLYDLCFVYL